MVSKLESRYESSTNLCRILRDVRLVEEPFAKTVKFHLQFIRLSCTLE
jgi:hypothetical protein